MREEFEKIFGKDILTKEFDADMYKGGAYIEIRENTAYIIELSWECNSLSLLKVSNISVDDLFNLIIEKTDDYYTIGYAYVMLHNEKDLDERTRIRNFLEVIYEREMEWILEDNEKSNYKVEHYSLNDIDESNF